MGRLRRFGPVLLGSATIASAALTRRFASNQLAVRATNAVAFMATISLLLAGMNGHIWQVDVPMYYSQDWPRSRSIATPAR
jgi:hypothetical protein